MKIAFKLSKVGVRVYPNPCPAAVQAEEDEEEEEPGPQSAKARAAPAPPVAARKEVDKLNEVNGITVSSTCSTGLAATDQEEVSFTLALYDRGYLIGKPGLDLSQPLPQDGLLHPYDRASELFFSAIEVGRLPGDALNDIPCKYYNGSVICEVRDCRKPLPEQGSTVPTVVGAPIIHKVRLRMTHENVIKDIPLISNNSWSYRDLLEAEARIVKALQPELCLDPTPRLDRLCSDPVPDKLDLGVGKRKRLQQSPECVVTSSINFPGKKVCIDKAPENGNARAGGSSFVNGGPALPVITNTNIQTLPGPSHAGPSNSLAQEAAKITPQPAGYPPIGNGLLAVKREPDLQNFDPKRQKQTIGIDDIQLQQQLLTRQQMQWNNYSSAMGSQRYQQSPSVSGQDVGGSFYVNQQGLKLGAGQEVDVDKLEAMSKGALQAVSNANPMTDPQNSRPQPLPHQSMARGNMTQWNARQTAEKDVKKEETGLKRKSAQSARANSGAMAQSPATAKSVGHPPASSPGDSMHKLQPAQIAAAKRKSNSVPKQLMSGIGSPASVGNMTAPPNTGSPALGASQAVDSSVLDRFGKLDSIIARYNINVKKNKVDDIDTTKSGYLPEGVVKCLSTALNTDDYTDEDYPLGKTLVGGTMNVCKNREIIFAPQGQPSQAGPSRPQLKLVLEERPPEGAIAMHYGVLEESDNPNSHESVVTLPTKQYADKLACEIAKLLIKDGYMKAKDHTWGNHLAGSNSNSNGLPAVFAEASPSEAKPVDRALNQQPVNLPAANANTIGPGSPLQQLQNNRMHPPVNSQAPAMSQSYMQGQAMPSRVQQLDPSVLQQQQQALPQQNVLPQLQQQQQQQARSSQMPPNQLPQMLGHSGNLPMDPNLNSKIQMMQHQAQQQQPAQLSRKVMMGNMGNSVVGLGGLGNMVNMGNVRGLSSQMGAMSQLGNIPNQMLGMSNLPQGRSNLLHPQAMMAARIRAAAQQRAAASMYAPQSGIAGMPGNNSAMLTSSAGLPMMGHTMNRANLSPLSRSSLVPMSAAKMPASSVPLSQQQQLQMHQQQYQQFHQNQQQVLLLQQQQQQQQLQQQQQMQQQQQQLQQQQLQQHQQLQQQQQQQQQQLQQQQQQQIGSPMQQMQVGSPSSVQMQQSVVTQQSQMSAQQMVHAAMSPQQLSSGAMQQVNSGGGSANTNLAVANSPQLSSHTPGSGGSIAGSPMEHLQGATNKGNAPGTM